MQDAELHWPKLNLTEAPVPTANREPRRGAERGRGRRPEGERWTTHVDPHALDQARGDLGIVTSRANTGNTLSVQWSLPG